MILFVYKPFIVIFNIFKYFAQGLLAIQHDLSPNMFLVTVAKTRPR